MKINDLKNLYKEQRENIRRRLEEFRNLREEEYLDEFLFCLLTPASNAKKCWEAVKQIRKQKLPEKNDLRSILRKYTRFHNNKTRYIIEGINKWNEITSLLKIKNRKELRNYLADNVEGYGMKEAGHFLRNIGKSDNQIAILDRHILRNLKIFGVIKNDKIKNKKDYLEAENRFLDFSRRVCILPDELDLLFWSKETGQIFK